MDGPQAQAAAKLLYQMRMSLFSEAELLHGPHAGGMTRERHLHGHPGNVSAPPSHLGPPWLVGGDG